MKKLRPYQTAAVTAVRGAWQAGARRICLVMPTGAGKTVTAEAIAQGLDALWLVHRREIQQQAPGRAVTIQQLVASGDRPSAELLIADECQHLAVSAPEWHAVAASYSRILGLTATPQRGDGSPLGDLFDYLIVGASYSELLAGGWLVDARVYRPPEPLEGLAMQPIDAYRKYGGDRQGFAYFSRVILAEDFSRGFDGASIISGETPKRDRDLILARFRAGELRVLSNCQCLTEGVDVPEASVCLIARGCQHQGAYLQMVGRVLRPAPGKDHAIVIDLSGASHVHGLPTEDREYSLEGRAIRAKLEPLRNCPACGRTQPSANGTCEECGYTWPAPAPKPPRIWDLPLEEAVAQAQTPKERGIARWREKMAAQGEGQRRAEWRRLKAVGKAKRFKPGWAKYQFRLRYGQWPHRGITG